jgi:hypothetical protein
MNRKTHLALAPFAFSQVTPNIVVLPRFDSNNFEVIFDVIGELDGIHE